MRCDRESAVSGCSNASVCFFFFQSGGKSRHPSYVKTASINNGLSLSWVQFPSQDMSALWLKTPFFSSDRLRKQNNYLSRVDFQEIETQSRCQNLVSQKASLLVQGGVPFFLFLFSGSRFFATRGKRSKGSHIILSTRAFCFRTLSHRSARPKSKHASTQAC